MLRDNNRQGETKNADEEIILLYKNGEQEAFKALIDRYASSLYNFAAHMAGRNDAPDIVQEIFIKVWKNIERFNPLKASFRTWIFTIAKNSITDFLRKKKSLLFSEMDEGGGENADSFSEKIPAEDPLPDQILQKLEDGKLLNEILEKLHPNYREVLALHYQEEMTFEEIGGILNKSPNTVKSRHRRAILELRKMLDAPN